MHQECKHVTNASTSIVQYAEEYSRHEIEKGVDYLNTYKIRKEEIGS